MVQSADHSGWDGVISWHPFSDAIRFVVGRVTIAFICVGVIAIRRRGPIYDPDHLQHSHSRSGRMPRMEGIVSEGREPASMLRARVPISRNSDGLWQVAQSLVEIDGRQIGLAALAPQPTPDEVIEEMMGVHYSVLIRMVDVEHRNRFSGTLPSTELRTVIVALSRCNRSSHAWTLPVTVPLAHGSASSARQR